MNFRSGSVRLSYDSTTFEYVIGFSLFRLLLIIVMAMICLKLAYFNGFSVFYAAAAGCLVVAAANCRNPVRYWKVSVNADSITVSTRRHVAEFPRTAMLVFYSSGDISEFMMDIGDKCVTIIPGPDLMVREYLPRFMRQAGVNYAPIAPVPQSQICSLSQYLCATIA